MKSLQKRQEDFANKTNIFISSLDVDETLAQLLVSEGFGSVEEVIETDKSELLSIDGFDEEIATELIERANKYLADKEDENQSKIEKLKVSEDLSQFELLSKAMIVKLAESDIKTLDDFAGLTTDDLIGYLEVKGDKNSRVAGFLEEFNLTREEGDQLIMEARKYGLISHIYIILLWLKIKIQQRRKKLSA